MMKIFEERKTTPSSIARHAMTGVFAAIAIVMGLNLLLQWNEAREISDHRAGIQQATDQFVSDVREGKHLRSYSTEQ